MKSVELVLGISFAYLSDNFHAEQLRKMKANRGKFQHHQHLALFDFFFLSFFIYLWLCSRLFLLEIGFFSGKDWVKSLAAVWRKWIHIPQCMFWDILAWKLIISCRKCFFIEYIYVCVWRKWSIHHWWEVSIANIQKPPGEHKVEKIIKSREEEKKKKTENRRLKKKDIFFCFY